MKYYVIRDDFNGKKLEKLNVITEPLIEEVRKAIKEKKNYEEVKEIVDRWFRYYYQYRAEHEILVSDLFNTYEEKIDVYDQLVNNLDVVVKLIIEEANKHIRKEKMVLEEE